MEEELVTDHAILLFLAHLFSCKVTEKSSHIFLGNSKYEWVYCKHSLLWPNSEMTEVALETVSDGAQNTTDRLLE